MPNPLPTNLYLGEPLHPPFGVTQPRMLIRWLDVNSQNGELTRTRYYFQVPTYNIPFTNTDYVAINAGWSAPFQLANYTLVNPIPAGNTFLWIPGNSNQIGGNPDGNGFPTVPFFNATYINGKANNLVALSLNAASITTLFGVASLFATPVTAHVYVILPLIIGAFDYYMVDGNNNPHSFSILGFNTPTSFNGTITVSYTNPDNGVVRYLLANDPNHPIFGSIPPYTNQLIKPYFRIEIWGSGLPENITGGPFTFYTTQKGNQDYRYSIDNLIVTPIIKTAFATANMNMPYIFQSPPTLNLF